MCCGSRRAAWRPASAPAYAPAGRPPAAPAPDLPVPRGPFPARPLRYDGTGEMRLRGPITGRAYVFSQAEPRQDVDTRDAAVFLRNVRFQPA